MLQPTAGVRILLVRLACVDLHLKGVTEIEAEGETVGDVLRGLADAHPGAEAQLFDDGGELNRYVNVYLNDEDVRVLDGLATSASETDVVVILPAMAGGRER